MSVSGVLASGRAAAEALMTDACTITRQTGEPTFDEQTGQYNYPPPTPVYSGKCKLQAPSLVNPIEIDAPERTGLKEQSVLSLPIEVTPVKGDVAEFTAAAFDSNLVGRKFTVVGQHHESQATARRVQVVETVG